MKCVGAITGLRPVFNENSEATLEVNLFCRITPSDFEKLKRSELFTVVLDIEEKEIKKEVA
jgi:hypothetical protein